MTFDFTTVESGSLLSLNNAAVRQFWQLMDDFRMIDDVDEPENGVRGVASYKLESNDGWVITPAEITAAFATAYRSIRRDDFDEPDVSDERVEECLRAVADEPWKLWLDHLRLGVREGGLRVT